MAIIFFFILGLLNSGSSGARLSTTLNPGSMKLPSLPQHTQESGPRRSLLEYSKWPKPTKSIKVSATIVVGPGEEFDGQMQMYYGIGSGSQKEDQPPMFKVMEGGIVRRVILGSPAGDGIHCMGSCRIEDCWWDDVGEDAATSKGRDPDLVMTIIGGGARNAADKVFQHDGPGKMVIQDFYCENFGKLWRSCGNCKESFTRHVVVDNVLIQPPFTALVGVNLNWDDTATLSRVQILGPKPQKPRPICWHFQGANKGSEPKVIGQGPNGKNCLYDESDVIYGATDLGTPTDITGPSSPSSSIPSPKSPPPNSPTTSGGATAGRAPPKSPKKKQSPPKASKSPPPRSPAPSGGTTAGKPPPKSPKKKPPPPKSSRKAYVKSPSKKWKPSPPKKKKKKTPSSPKMASLVHRR